MRRHYQTQLTTPYYLQSFAVYPRGLHVLKYQLFGVLTPSHPVVVVARGGHVDPSVGRQMTVFRAEGFPFGGVPCVGVEIGFDHVVLTVCAVARLQGCSGWNGGGNLET